MNNELFSRDDFREGVFKRDNYTCVICGGEGQDAHHILERRLWSDGGYYLNNGSTLCGSCHMKAEQTLISVEEIREGCGITEILLPKHFHNDDNYTYDKWGNPILPNGDRLIGELFFEEPVQKVLSPILNKFRHYIQYPRTYHVPFSQGDEKRDRHLEDMSYFEGQRVIITEKMNGENITMYNDYIHAHSIDGGLNPSGDWIKSLWERIGWEIPDRWRVCGEDLYRQAAAQNSENHFWVFSIWNESNECISWNETVEYCEILNLKTVPVLYDGIYDEEVISKIRPNEDFSKGWVIRIADSFLYKDFRKCVAQFKHALIPKT